MDKVRENRLRRLAYRKGMELRKLRQGQRAEAHGPYMLIRNNAVEAYGLRDLNEVEYELT